MLFLLRINCFSIESLQSSC